MGTFVVDVQFSTHDDLKDGRTTIGVRRFILLADNDVDASLTACQIVAAQGFMPTRTLFCI